MAKRLTDTDKWKDDWYIQLSNDDKIVWQWLLDNCSHAGVCKRSMGLLNMMCNVKYKEDEMIEKMDGRVITFENNWFIPKFIKFQYTTLHSLKPVIVSVVKELYCLKITKMIPQSFGNDYILEKESFDNHYKMIKDKDKDKDKDKVNTYSKANFSKNLIPENIWIDNVEHKPIKNGDGWVYPTIEAVSVTDDNLAVFEDNTTQPLGKRQTALKSQNCLDLKMVKKGLVQ